MIDTSGINVLYWTEFNPTKFDVEEFEEFEEIENKYNQFLIEDFIQANGFIPEVSLRNNFWSGH